MKHLVMRIDALSFLSWPALAKISKRLEDEILIIRSRTGFTFECRKLLDGSIELSNTSSHAIAGNLVSAISVIELIDRLNPNPVMRPEAKVEK